MLTLPFVGSRGVTSLYTRFSNPAFALDFQGNWLFLIIEISTGMEGSQGATAYCHGQIQALGRASPYYMQVYSVT